MKRVIVVLSICIVIMLSGCSDKDQGKFTVGSMSPDEFPPDQPYFLVVPIEWSGSQPAVIDSVKIVVGDTDIQDTEGISYEFYGGHPNKAIGVYPKDTIGGKQNIQGHEIKEEGTLILKVKLSNVNKNDNRQMKIHYTVDGEKREQTISTSTVEELSTK
ncbi:hypothetical protein CSV71_10395 [Sporosarcina sp. P21c]|uniref:hypothetical protein n=1 Tax=unclassified Sporosarcina TaxID=2647733 RepID=UPI000C16A955|nr:MULTISPECIES: hypothetical protein [unclassified Sporosarcina]PIC67630.1 hypothetical protein CSV78_06920 [Sporosarcina sp. P16a]PIC89324.1 hypothetical protein CSV71_10395 [Sporosarcina sp. P21c]PIC93081.1 hypothetical protein CSV70_07670 [Sporosarcina sp. P25]